jgi:glycosyltransferase involved in cell wall biosynthesis
MAGPFDTTHGFVVPVYGAAPWLGRCLDSIQGQSVESRAVVTTSTPSAELASLCASRRLPLFVNPVARGIAADWNFSLSHGTGEWVTIAHQDDWYEREYVDACLGAVSSVPQATMIFTAATEILVESGRTAFNTVVKRAMCAAAFLGQRSIHSTARKRLLLSFGNPIPCASVMINRRLRPAFEFPEGWRSNLDWRAWLALADAPGSFVYVPRPLVHRSLHTNAATTRDLDARAREDALMFRELWPRPIASALNGVYAASRLPYGRLRPNE